MNLVYRNFKLDLREDGIAIFSANRPAVKNAMNIDAWKEFHAFCGKPNGMMISGLLF